GSCSNRSSKQTTACPLPFGRQWPRALRTSLTQSRQVSLRFPLGCCPHGWTLFRWKCLWASSEKKTWGASNRDCEWRSSRLLVLPEPWSARELWEAVGKAFTEVRKGRAKSL
uniref:Uncharacterized protein n=1 Tax=Naja naja TaxID=35670 RepID=A0A8C6YGN8_NAJNA